LNRETTCDQMLEVIEREFLATARLTGLQTLPESVREAMQSVPRHAFVPMHEFTRAYDDAALYIGRGQTISQPYIVALMTTLLNISPDHIVLEVGTGSGYQAAILGCLAKKVYSIERIVELARQAKELLDRLGIHNVEVCPGDGCLGLPERAPFDAIMVTAAAEHVPSPLVDQIKPCGRMVIPVGLPGYTQELILIEKDATGKVQQRDILPVAFVPLIGSDC